jgi:hypothetical protein
MTVSLSAFRNDYLAAAGATEFSYTFRILDESHLAVYVNDVLQTLTTHYTVTGVDESAGGEVTFVTPLAADDRVALLRDVPLDQQTDYRYNDKFPEEEHEKALDKLTMIAQQQSETFSRALLLAPSTSTADLTLPDPEADLLLRWKTDLTGLENVEVVDLGAGVPSDIVPEAITMATGLAGTSSELSRSDHKHEITAPAAGYVEDVAAAEVDGVSARPARADHVHKLGIITTEGDIIQGGAAGVPERLPIGAADTFIGRDGTKAGWRTAQQVRESLEIHKNRCVMMIPSLTTYGEWEVYAPDGSLLDITGTTTQGLQEAIDYACEFAWGLIVRGRGSEGNNGGSPSFDPSVITCSSTVTFPVNMGQGKVFWFDAVTVAFPAAGIGANDGFKIQDAVMCQVYFNGQIGYEGTGAALRFKPAVGAGAQTIVDSRFYFQTLAYTGNGSTGCIWEVPGGTNIGGNTFEFSEVNGSSVANTVGLKVIGSATNLFQGNYIAADHLHANMGISAAIGTAGTDLILGNHWRLNISPAGVAGNTALQVFSKRDTFFVNITNGEGTPVEGIKLEASAALNRFFCLVNDATTKVNDSSTDKSSIGMYGEWKPRFSAHKGGAGQTGIVTATPTKVTFGTEVYDYGSGFASSTWTPGRIGIAHISACATWDATVDTGRYQIYVYKNGSAHKAVSLDAGSVKTQGPAISVDVLVDAITDTFEIYVEHDSGSNKDISGNSVYTYFMGHMVD